MASRPGDRSAHEDKTRQVAIDELPTVEDETLEFSPSLAHPTFEAAPRTSPPRTPEPARLQDFAPQVDPTELKASEPARVPGAPDLEGYRIVAKIGAGAMGVVYEAVRIDNDRRVAIKQLNSAASARRELVGRFLAEAVAGSRMEHPGVAKIYDYGHDENGVPFLVMELLDGEALSDRLKRRRASPGEFFDIARAIGEVMAAAHERDIVHRDLKPDNIFLCRSGAQTLKILDFGIAKFLSDTLHLNATATGQMLGTPYYMSPEQCAGEPVDARSDIYSLGCVMYEMLVGRVPFTGNIISVVTGHRERKPTPLDAINPELPANLVALVHSMLAKKADRRPASMSAVVAALVALSSRSSPPATAGVAGAASVALPSPAETADLSQPRAPRRSLATSLFVGLVLLAIGVALGVLLS